MNWYGMMGVGKPQDKGAAEAKYLISYLREIGSVLDLSVRVALECADAAYADDPDGDPEEAAQSEISEWENSL